VATLNGEFVSVRVSDTARALHRRIFSASTIRFHYQDVPADARTAAPVLDFLSPTDHQEHAGNIAWRAARAKHHLTLDFPLIRKPVHV